MVILKSDIEIIYTIRKKKKNWNTIGIDTTKLNELDYIYYGFRARTSGKNTFTTQRNDVIRDLPL